MKDFAPDDTAIQSRRIQIARAIEELSAQ